MKACGVCGPALGKPSPLGHEVALDRPSCGSEAAPGETPDGESSMQKMEQTNDLLNDSSEVFYSTYFFFFKPS